MSPRTDPNRGEHGLRELVDLLTDWGAAERPGNRELFSALEAARTAPREAIAAPPSLSKGGSARSHRPRAEPLAAAARAGRENHEREEDRSAIAKPRGGSWLRPALVVLAVVVLGSGALFTWSRAGAGSRTYRFSTVGSRPDGAPVSLSLARGGRIVARGSLSAGDVLELDLGPGRYAVFVDGRFSGRVVVAPDDPPAVDDVPDPAGAAELP